MITATADVEFPLAERAVPGFGGLDTEAAVAESYKFGPGGLGDASEGWESWKQENPQDGVRQSRHVGLYEDALVKRRRKAERELEILMVPPRVHQKANARRRTPEEAAEIFQRLHRDGKERLVRRDKQADDWHARFDQ